MTKEEIIKRIIKEMNDKKISYRKMAQEAKIDLTTVFEIVNNKRDFKVTTLLKMLDVLGVEMLIVDDQRLL